MFVLFLFFVLAKNSYAQDSREKFKLSDIFLLSDTLDNTAYFLFRLDDRRTLVRNQPVDVKGVQFGIQKRRIKIWGGVAFIDAPLRTRLSTNMLDTLTINTDLVFFSLIPEYIFMWRKYYELSFALGIGVGNSLTKTERQPQNTLTTRENLFLPIEPALKLAIKPTRWIGLNASIGYRETISITQANFNYSGLFYSYGLSLYLGNMYDDILLLTRPKNKVNQPWGIKQIFKSMVK